MPSPAISAKAPWVGAAAASDTEGRVGGHGSSFCDHCSLRRMCLAGGLSGADIEYLAGQIHRPPPLRSGEALFRAGEPFEELLVLRAGCVKTVESIAGAADQVTGFYLPGDVLGLMAIAEGRHPCDCIAVERTSVCALPFRCLERLATEYPALQRKLFERLSGEILVGRAYLAPGGRNSATRRVALFLASWSRRLAAAGQRSEEFRLAMPRSDIANHLGLALATVSRAFGELAEAGLLEVHGRRVRILDPEALASGAG